MKSLYQKFIQSINIGGRKEVSAKHGQKLTLKGIKKKKKKIAARRDGQRYSA